MDKSSKEHTAFDDKTGPFLKSLHEGKEGSNEKIAVIRVVQRPPSLPNKPWEPPFKLKLNPPDYIGMRWVRGVSVYAQMTITNNSNTPQCYKMKCTDNAQFRVRPPTDFIPKGASASVKIIHNSYVFPEPNKHYFAIYHAKCTPEDVRTRNFKKIWRPNAQPDGVIRVPVAFDTTDQKTSQSQKAGAPPSSGGSSVTAGRTVSGPARSVTARPNSGRKRSNRRK